MITPKITGVVFYSVIAAWCVAIVVGVVAEFPYASRRYAGVTLPCVLGVLLLVLAFFNYRTGVIWWGRARSINRPTEPKAYWIALCAMGIAGGLLLCSGVFNWMKLP